ncbi:2-dehydro-3-deoxyphosphooctonate aldolase [Chlorella sorokiniana]|uniref:2-dehydro-3-deoxyphosphooctonate aldolase n=1 Tax=Chlorella sorokiniana TaxID=3076 RepID=A0A2P6U409_CHLSO|nr:2-dehydro-3-deoxyphosphooctonate aldolase [Chlorella sorokiniana]|eukprot:PRW61057.1 2-dehydro-3-deoxyphosphooctonate aldolase [Chlorella sorokiniana]
MPKADARLYAALLRTGARFRTAGMPLLGVAGTDCVCWDLSWPATVRRELQSPPPGVGLAEGAQALSKLQRQLGLLLQAEEHTREALAEWAALADRFAARQSEHYSSALSLAVATEAGLALLSRQAQHLADPLQLELQEDAEQAEAGAEALSLDELAAAVRQQYPQLFLGSSGGGGSAGSMEVQVQQALALAGVLYRQQRFKHEPFEWVYEGLQPLLLPPRLWRRKLAPLTLATVAAGVAQRLGLQLLPVPAEPDAEIAAGMQEGPAGGAAAQGGLPLEQLRSDVAQRYAGRASAAAPELGPWLLLLPDHGTMQQQGQQVGVQWQHAMDACGGQLIDAADALRQYPALQQPAGPRLLSPLLGWQHMVRTVIQAHQRRGESDLVAHWVYVLLALDPQAPEWGHMLAG